MEDFISSYLAYTDNSEPPKIFHRWAAITGIGAYLGRQTYFEHGHFTIYPNIYSMLIGSPGTRKSTAIKMMRKILMEAGYNTIAADKSTKEKFLLDLAGEGDLPSTEDILEQNLFGSKSKDGEIYDTCSEMFIMADEFNDFFGNGNIEFVSLLGTLWDYSGTYRNRIKNGKSVNISNPTISILGGNTPTGFALAFPTEIFGQGFFSRLLLIHGESSGKRITFPPPPTKEATRGIIEALKRIRISCQGPAELTPNAADLLDKIYKTARGVDDVRFESYSTRRFTHLLKLCIVLAASAGSKSIDEQIVIRANTTLYYAEFLMPKALGEFGKAKHSDTSQKILALLESSDKPLGFKEIWKHLNQDLERMTDLATLLQNLVAADKVQSLPEVGFLPKKKILEEVDSSLIDYSFLTPEERRIIL